jgi:Rhodopirellula transposase DDE domain
MTPRYSLSRRSASGGKAWARTNIPTPTGSSSPPTVADPTDTAPGSGNTSSRLAATTGLEIIVSHYPPGTSKWNKIEHRLFSRITQNWRGRPLETYQTIVNLIANTTTTTGLTVRCELDPNVYPTKIKLTDQQKESIPLTRHLFHGDWNYTITPPSE